MQDGSRRRARLILIVGVALALVAGVGTFVYASGAKSDQPVAVPTVAVLVAAREIPAKTTLASDRSEERRVGKECLTQCRSRWSPYH